MIVKKLYSLTFMLFAAAAYHPVLFAQKIAAKVLYVSGQGSDVMVKHPVLLFVR